MPNHFDVIVVGVGSMGSATCYELAKAGLSVLGLEANSIVNDEASHSGQTRIVRKAYFEHPDYVPLLNAAYKGWETLEASASGQLYHPVGLAYFGKKDHPLLQSVKDSSAQYKLPLQELDKIATQELLSDFEIPNHYVSLLEPEAGFVCTDQVIKTYCDLAVAEGAILKEHEGVQQWDSQLGIVHVTTNTGRYTCDKLILTGGAGNAQLLPKTMASLKVTRQLISWVRPKNATNLKLGKLPCWVYAPKQENGIFYGFPMLPESYGGHEGLKVAHHFPGEAVQELTKGAIDVEKQKIEAMMNEFMPEIFNGFLEVTTCLYTYSQDEHFIVDFVPDTDHQVLTAAGFSGHGFKFVPVIGEVLKDLALVGETRHPVGFLKASRE